MPCRLYAREGRHSLRAIYVEIDVYDFHHRLTNKFLRLIRRTMAPVSFQNLLFLSSPTPLPRLKRLRTTPDVSTSAPDSPPAPPPFPSAQRIQPESLPVPAVIVASVPTLLAPAAAPPPRVSWVLEDFAGFQTHSNYWVVEKSVQGWRDSIDKLVFGSRDNIDRGYDPAVVNITGCRLAQKATQGKGVKGYVQITWTSARGSKGIEGGKEIPRGAHQVICVLEKSLKDVENLLFRGYQCSHRCHNSRCFNSDHITVEPKKDNEERKECADAIEVHTTIAGVTYTLPDPRPPCTHSPSCIRRVEEIERVAIVTAS